MPPAVQGPRVSRNARHTRDIGQQYSPELWMAWESLLSMRISRRRGTAHAVFRVLKTGRHSSRAAPSYGTPHRKCPAGNGSTTVRTGCFLIDSNKSAQLDRCRIPIRHEGARQFHFRVKATSFFSAKRTLYCLYKVQYPALFKNGSSKWRLSEPGKLFIHAR